MILYEKDIARVITDYLELDGWRAIKMEAISRREWGKGTGEKGQPDYLYIRYGPTGDIPKDCIERAMYTQAMWIEHKRKTGKVAAHQHAWHAAERARGALTLIAGIDFTASTDGFMDWYENSGLLRNVRRLNPEVAQA